MADEEQQAAALTPAQRRRNVSRVKDIETSLGRVEQEFAAFVLAGASAIRTLHEMREELRDVFGMDPLGPVAPLYEKLATRADDEEES